MTVELKMLVWSVLLGVVQIVLAAAASVAQRGLGWAAGSRDVTPPLTGVAGRLDRARANFLETFALFAALVLIGTALARHDAHTEIGAQLCFWARVIYVPIYAAGIAYVRTLVWGMSMVGVLLLLLPLF